jgi:hypothetical protein
VLLALIDRERNLRAGVLTLSELEAKLQGTVKPNEVMQATDWLASGEVRLITPVERQNKTGYELAHERIIPAVVRLAGQELKAAERANHLLDRRVNEWLGNGRSNRYLLSWRELWLLHQQKAYLVWGTNRKQKERLLRQSWQRVYRAGWALLAALVLLLSGFGVLAESTRTTLANAMATGRSEEDVRLLLVKQQAVAFVKVGNQRAAFNMIDSINDPSSKVAALSSIASVYGQTQCSRGGKGSARARLSLVLRRLMIHPPKPLH